MTSHLVESRPSSPLLSFPSSFHLDPRPSDLRFISKLPLGSSSDSFFPVHIIEKCVLIQRKSLVSLVTLESPTKSNSPSSVLERTTLEQVYLAGPCVRSFLSPRRDCDYSDDPLFHAVTSRYDGEEQGRARRLLGAFDLPSPFLSSFLLLSGIFPCQTYSFLNRRSRFAGQVHESVHRQPHESGLDDSLLPARGILPFLRGTMDPRQVRGSRIAPATCWSECEVAREGWLVAGNRSSVGRCPTANLLQCSRVRCSSHICFEMTSI